MEEQVRNLELRTRIAVPCLVHGDADARPVLLLHAWGESRKSFDRLVPLLPGCRIYAPDLRGQGDADKPESGYCLSDQADDVAAILDALDVPKVCVLGSSSGGYIAQQVAVTYPERVVALVLVGVPLSLHGRAPFADEVERLADPVDENWVRESLSWFPLLHGVPSWFIEDRVLDGLKMPAHAWKGILHGLSTATPPTDTGSIRAPTLLLWGEQDGLLPREDQHALATRIPGSVVRIYPGVAHLVLWECPDRVARDTLTFLDSID
jgi:pimeloyl-ACP methyl ester carboxylesterase